MTANDRMVGGDHYQKIEGEQHWDRVARLGLNYFEASATKYIERSRLKGQMRKDLEKAKHFVEKQLELLDAELIAPSNPEDPDYPIPALEPARRGRKA